MSRSDEFERYASTDAVRKDLRRKSLRGAMFTAAASGIDLLLRFASIAILARLVSPEHFGIVAMVTALTGVVEGVRDLGLATATVQRKHITHWQVSNLFWVNAAAGFGFTIMFCVLSPSVTIFYREERLASATMAMALAFLWSGLSVQHEALMSRQLRQGELAFIRVSASIISIGLAIGLAYRGYGYWALVWREVVRSAIIALGVWMRCPWLPGLPRRGTGTLQLLRFGRDLSATHLLISLIANVDRLLIGRFYGPIPVGLYRQAQQLLMVPIDQLNAPIMAVAQPGLSALQSEPERYRRYYEEIVFLVALSTVPLGLFIAVYADEITLLVLGPAWSEAAVFISIFGLAAAIRPAIATSAAVLVSSGRSGRYFAVAVVHSVVLTALLVFGVQWGPEGVALAHVATTLVLAVPKLYYSFEATPVSLRVFAGAIRTPVIAGTIMVLGLLALRKFVSVDAILPEVLIGAGVAGTLYMTAWLLQPTGWSQLKGLTSYLVIARRSAR
jgi:O-antigen/teichoic acid export membrane protein